MSMVTIQNCIIREIQSEEDNTVMEGCGFSEEMVGVTAKDNMIQIDKMQSVLMEFEDTDVYQAILDNDTQHLKQLLLTEDVNRRGYDGSSYLHVAIDQGAHRNIVTQLLNKTDISHRDENGDTALDLAVMRQATHLQWLILQHFCRLLIEGKTETLEHLLQQGWDAWPVDVEEVKDFGKDVQMFFSDLPMIRKKIYQVHHCIEQNSQEYLKSTLTSHALSVACDHTGLPPLQKAVIFQRHAIAEYIIRKFPKTINIADNMGRTALHYAACSSDDAMCSMLKKAGADEEIKDLTGTTPTIFQNNAGLFALKDVQHHLETRQRTHSSGLEFRLSTLNTPPPPEDKTSILLKHQRPSMSNLPNYITTHRQKSLTHESSVSNEHQTPDPQPMDHTCSPVYSPEKDRSECILFEETKLYEAVVMNDTAFVEHLLKTDHDTNLRSLEGWSYLHLAISHSADVMILQRLMQKVDISVHDVDGKTALDLLVGQPQKSKTIELFQKEILGYFACGEIAQLKRLAMNGWSLWPPCNDVDIKMIAADKSRLFLQNIGYVQKTVQELHQSAAVDDLRTLKSTIRRYSRSESSRHVLDNDEILRACDSSGIPLFIKTVIFNSKNSFRHLLDSYPQLVSCVDNMDRTALHYWTDVNDVMYNKLIESGVDQSCYDLWGMPATEYQRNPHLLGLDSLILRLSERKSHSQTQDNQHWPQYLMMLLNREMDDSEIFKAIRANNIDGVKESMENCDFSMRDNDGRSLLQMAVMENTDIEIFRLMLEKVDIGIRDVYGETVSDLIVQEAYRKEAMEDIMKYLIQLGRDGNIDKLTTLLLNGWNQWSVTVPEAKEISEEFGDFVEKIEEFQNKVKDIHKAIQEGRERDVKSLMDRKLLAVATDQTGMPPLQKAVVFNNIDMVEFIITEFPGTVSLTDNMGRTALHYAGGSLDGGHLYNLIKDANADEDKKDVTGKTPKDYYENPEQLSADTIKEKVLEMQENAKKREEEWAASQLASNLALGKESKEKILAPRVLKQKSFSRQPVRMYISQDIYAKRTVPPPTTVDGKYISKNVGSALTMALAEIAELRPWDPIEYLAQWLYKYQANMDYNKRQEDLLAQIRQDEKDLLEEEKMRVRRKEEQQQIQEKEEMKRKKLEEEERRRIMEEEAMAKAREEALAKGSMLSTVAEDKEGEEESLLKDRDEHGQTELHKLASQQGADLVALINMNYSLADRDGNNQTARDIAEENNIQDNVESIDAYISNLIEQEKLETIQQFLLDGYDKLMVVLENVSTEGLPSEVIEFIESLPVFQEKISAVFRALDKGEIRTVAQVLDRKKLVLIKDVYGRSPLHIAVLRENQALVKYIVKHYPISAKCRDNMNRTPLHYAMAISNDLAYLLISYKADQEAKDVKQRKPEYYKEARDEILKLKESLPAVQAEDNSQKGEVKSEPTEPTNVPSVGSSGQEVPTTAGDEEEVN